MSKNTAKNAPKVRKGKKITKKTKKYGYVNEVYKPSPAEMSDAVEYYKQQFKEALQNEKN